MEIISTTEIYDLQQKLREASYEETKNSIRAKLGKIADSRPMIEGEDGLSSDDVRDSLQGFGTYTAADHFSATYGTIFEPRRAAYKDGMGMLGLPYEEIERLATSFEKGHIPSDVIDTVVNHQAEINSLHPDKYPFKDSAHDVVANGLSRAGINTRRIWKSIEKNLRRRKRADLALRYGYDSEPTNALTWFLAHYALTRHDIGALKRAHF